VPSGVYVSKKLVNKKIGYGINDDKSSDYCEVKKEHIYVYIRILISLSTTNCATF
jgi:hypothetical protein